MKLATEEKAENTAKSVKAETSEKSATEVSVTKAPDHTIDK